MCSSSTLRCSQESLHFYRRNYSNCVLRPNAVVAVHALQHCATLPSHQHLQLASRRIRQPGTSGSAQGAQLAQATCYLMVTGAVDLRNALAARFGVELPATAVYDHPTPAALAAQIAKLQAAKQPAQAPGIAGHGNTLDDGLVIQHWLA